jgi:hypothetical protein
MLKIWLVRYAEGETAPLASSASDDMLVLTAVLGFFIGFALIYLGRLGQQMWMWVWGAGLVLMSLYMGLVTWFSH